jgi:hypothetical protein
LFRELDRFHSITSNVHLIAMPFQEATCNGRHRVFIFDWNLSHSCFSSMVMDASCTKPR